jgi:hypothetical protein
VDQGPVFREFAPSNRLLKKAIYRAARSEASAVDY